MSRPSSLWFRTRDGFWMTTINGVQHKLSQDKTVARKMLIKLLASDQPTPKKAGMSTRKLCDLFAVRTEERRNPKYHLVVVAHLKAFCDKLGHRDPMTIKVHEVETWLEGQETWAKTTRALFITIIKSVFNWAEEQGYVSANPIKKLKRGNTGRRKRLLTAEERKRIEGAVSARMNDFLFILSQTGCRPFSELAKLTADMIDFEKGRAVLEVHKTAKKTGRVRQIYFPPPALERLKELAVLRPTGPLLVNRYGTAWTANTAGYYIRRVCKKLGIKGVSSYTIRHSWITGALVRGVPVEVVAELAGNSPAVIHKNYSQIDKMTEALQAAAKKAVG
jgi:integrase